MNEGFAQWATDPSENTKLVLGGSSPVDISTVTDSRGGSFIFWQDGRSMFLKQVLFIHVDNDGKVTMRADGKKIAEGAGPEESPVAASSLPNTASVVWKDMSLANSGNLLAQRVTASGSYLWQPRGVEVTSGNNEIYNYSACSDASGALFVTYVSKKPGLNGAYNIELQKLSAEGEPLFNSDSTRIYSSADRIGFTTTVPDDSGGVFVLWLQYHNNTGILYAQHADSSGHTSWGGNAVRVSGSKDNVILYSAKKLNFPAVYVAWQNQKNTRGIYQQIINGKGKNLWTSGGKLATPQPGRQTNPDEVVSDSSVILCWNQESGKDRDIYLQKFSLQGKPVWGPNPVPVIKYKGDQFGQKIIPDGKGGAVVAWIDRRNDSTYGDIYAQKINSKGRKLWDPLGLKVGTNYNTLKSYLSLVSDLNGGAVAIFKNKRGNKDGIYGQRIFSSGTYASQIIAFNTAVAGDSVKVSWYSANEEGKIKYTVERTNRMDTDSIRWDDIGYVYSNGQPGAKQYQYFDSPDTTGTLYYRLLQSDSNGVIQTSDISRINYFGRSSDVVIAQNMPNPFSDSTMISFYLPDSADVNIEFYNSHVEKIKVINRFFPSGENKISFSAEGLNPGIYFYRFKVDNFVDVKKMVVIK